MSTETERLRNLLEDELGECREEDVSRRLGKLDDLLAEAGADDASTDADVFSALGNDTRYLIVRLLATADDDLCPCEFESLIDVSQSAISHALSTLVDAGLVERRPEGKWRYYRATPLAEGLLDALDADHEGRDE